MSQSQLKIEIAGCDQIEVVSMNPAKLNIKVCSQTLDLLNRLKKEFGENIEKWESPKENSHSDILIRELILKLKGEWNYPIQNEEVCHCRLVATQKVDKAITEGAHSIESVRRVTSANTACGTCQLDIEAMIRYRLN